MWGEEAKLEEHCMAARPEPSICMPTLRGIWREAFQSGLYEGQDVLAETCDVDLLELQPGRGFQARDRWLRRLLFRGLSPGLTTMNPGLQKVHLRRDYDLFIAVCQNFWDLLYINAIEGWQDRCKTSVCWLGEIWISDLAACPSLLRKLQRFDHIFLNNQGTVEPLSRFLDRQCYLLPTATDTVRFSPFPTPPERSIDVYSIGRRWEGIHNALLQAASQRGLFYVYDTYRSMATMELVDYKQHRALLANMAKRSKCFLVSPGKMNLPGETGGQVEVGYRYFEGAAAGAVMVGQPADCDAFREFFPWPEAVIEIRSDGTNVLDVLAKLDADPDRADAIRRRNAAESLVRHDWVHRWNKIFQVSGVEPSARMRAREAHLKSLAGRALQTEAGSVIGIRT